MRYITTTRMYDKRRRERLARHAAVNSVSCRTRDTGVNVAIIFPSAPANTQDAKRYANGMAEIRQRLGIARRAVARIRETQNQDLVSTETIFLQMRKVCELIAFGSLIANKELYFQHYETFAEDWRLGA